VSELCHIPPETQGKHRDLRGRAEAHRCCGRLLIGSALVGFGVRQHAPPESISKRAPSTARTSLRLESTICERRTTIIAHAGGSRSLRRILFAVTGFGAHDTDVRANCVRPLNVPRSLTAIYSSCLWAESRAKRYVIFGARHSGAECDLPMHLSTGSATSTLAAT